MKEMSPHSIYYFILKDLKMLKKIFRIQYKKTLQQEWSNMSWKICHIIKKAKFYSGPIYSHEFIFIYSKIKFRKKKKK